MSTINWRQYQLETKVVAFGMGVWCKIIYVLIYLLFASWKNIHLKLFTTQYRTLDQTKCAQSKQTEI